jgi:hypothetical protein
LMKPLVQSAGKILIFKINADHNQPVE